MFWLSCNMLQKTLKHTPYGRISVKCYYDPPEQRLTVEILHAADIIALDANGISNFKKFFDRYKLLNIV